MARPFTLIVAGGGTGGHFFGGVAVGEELLRQFPDARVVYVGTRAGIEARVAPREGLDLRFITVAGIKGRGLVARLRALAILPWSLVQSLWLVLKERPDAVLGVGGYASGPVLLAAWLLWRPTLVLEQNSVPGATNRILARLVRTVCVSFDAARAHFPRARAIEHTGNPTRARLVSLLGQGGEPAGWSSETDPLPILLFGGSQGARSLNRAMVAAWPLIPADVRGRIQLVHQTGRLDHQEVLEGYRVIGAEVEVTEFIHDMAAAWQRAALVLCRAGASTISELTIAGRPAVLVPFPHAIYDHQTRNAEAVVAAGGAILLPDSELSGERLAALLVELAADRTRLRTMASASRELGRPDAAAQVLAVARRLAGR